MRLSAFPTAIFKSPPLIRSATVLTESRCYNSQADANIHHMYASIASIQQSKTCKENTAASFLRFENRLNRAGGSPRLFSGWSAKHLCFSLIAIPESFQDSKCRFQDGSICLLLWSDWPRIAT